MLDWGMAGAVCGSVLLLRVREVQGILFAVLSHDCVARVTKLSKFTGMPTLVKAFSPSYITRRRCKVVDYLMVCATVQL